MGLQIHRLPLLVQVLVFALMKLQDKIAISTLSKKCRRLSKIFLKSLSLELRIYHDSYYVMTANEETLVLDFGKYNSKESNSKTYNFMVLKQIFVLDVKSYRDHDGMTRKMLEFIFEIFTNLTITVVGENIVPTAKLLDTIKNCKNNYANEKTVMKLGFGGTLPKRNTLPPLHCDEVTFQCRVGANELIEMVMACKRVIVPSSSGNQIPGIGLSDIFKAWKKDSPIEYMELTVDQSDYETGLAGLSKRHVSVDGQNRNCHVIRQASGNEAVVFVVSNSGSHELFLRTDFEEVEQVDE